MKTALKYFALTVPFLALTGGCDPFDYYPEHEAHVSGSDLDKSGESGQYGGTGTQDKIEHPKGMDTTNPGSSSKPVDTKPAVSFGLGGSTSIDESQTGSYGGSNVGGGTSGFAPNRPADDGRISTVSPSR